MPRKASTGRPRKNGRARAGGSQALSRRYYRAILKAKQGQRLKYHEIQDLHAYLRSLRKKEHLTCQRVADKIELDIENYVGEQIMANEKKTKKAKATIAEKLTTKYAGIIESLLAGDENTDYTLLPIKKAKVNSTVEHLVDVNDEVALCQYKK